MNRIDKGEIYKWFNLFVAWKENPLVEIRIIGRRTTASGYFTDPDSIIESIERYENDNIYFTINSLSDEHRSRPQFGKILEGKKATCFPGFEEELKGAEVTGEKVVVDGNIITAKGAGCALDFGFTIVSQIQSKADAGRIAASMQC